MDLIGSGEAKHQARNRVLGLADADLAGPVKATPSSHHALETEGHLRIRQYEVLVLHSLSCGAQ